MSDSRLRRVQESLDLLAALRESNDLKIWSRMLEKIAVALNAEFAAYRYYDTMSKKLVAFHAIGAQPADLPQVEEGQGTAGWVARFKDIKTADGGRSIALPLSINLDFVGTYEFVQTEGNAFSEEDVKLAALLIRETSHAIRRLRLEDMVNRVTAYNASILDNLSGGFFAVDLQGRVMICNPAARRILGVEGEVTDLPVEKVLSQVPELAVILRGTVSSKKTEKRKDLRWNFQGQPRLLGYSTLLIQDTKGELTGAGVTFQDLTNLKK